MAKKRMRTRNRDRTQIANRRLVPVSYTLSDRRQFHPEFDFRPVTSKFRFQRAVVIASPRVSPGGFVKHKSLADPFSFQVPKAVDVCVRRKQRREVLFALKRTRSGGAKRRNYWSGVSCR